MNLVQVCPSHDNVITHTNQSPEYIKAIVGSISVFLTVIPTISMYCFSYKQPNHLI